MPGYCENYQHAYSTHRPELTSSAFTITSLLSRRPSGTGKLISLRMSAGEICEGIIRLQSHLKELQKQGRSCEDIEDARLKCGIKITVASVRRRI